MTAKKTTKISEDTYKRLAADFANFQRRAEEEKVLLSEHIKAGVMEALFPVLDNFHRAATHAPEIPVDGNLAELSEDDFKKIRTYFDGLRSIEKQLTATLESLGLARIATTGEAFNPNLHEAVSYENDPQVAEDHIIDEVQPGYQLQGRVIRPAKVRVSKG